MANDTDAPDAADATGPRGAGANAVPTDAMVVKAEDQIVRSDLLPGGDTEGTRRGVANGFAGTACMVNVLEMPVGQSSPMRRFSGEHIVYQLVGSVVWVVDGVDHRIDPGDMLFVPVHRAYSFRNVGDVDARFIDIAGKVEEWPPAMSYDDGTRLESSSMGDLFN